MSQKYRGSFVKWNHCSWERRTRSVTDSGNPFGFAHTTSARKIQPLPSGSAWPSMQPIANRHGRPMRDFGRMPYCVGAETGPLGTLASVSRCPVRLRGCAPLTPV